MLIALFLLLVCGLCYVVIAAAEGWRQTRREAEVIVYQMQPCEVRPFLAMFDAPRIEQISCGVIEVFDRRSGVIFLLQVG